MGQESDAAGKIARYCHLLAIQQGYAIPALSMPGDRRGKNSIEIGGHREGDREHLAAVEMVAFDEGIEQLGHGFADGFAGICGGGGGAPEGP